VIAAIEELLEETFYVLSMQRLYITRTSCDYERVFETGVRSLGVCCEMAASLRGREPQEDVTKQSSEYRD
jgi:hypothetical protein